MKKNNEKSSRVTKVMAANVASKFAYLSKVWAIRQPRVIQSHTQNFNITGNDGKGDVVIGINPSTSEVIKIVKLCPYPNINLENAKISGKEALTKVQQFLKKRQLPSIPNGFKMEEPKLKTTGKKKHWDIVWRHFVDDAQVLSDFIYFKVSAETGEIESYSKVYHDIDEEIRANVRKPKLSSDQAIAKAKEILGKGTLKGYDPNMKVLRVILKNSPYLRWSFVHVAKKFGALRRDVDWEAVNLQRLLKIFDQTPLLDEVFAKVFWERMDLENTKKVLEMIKQGEIQVIITKLSPIGKTGLGPGRMLIPPARADHATLMALKRRLEDSMIYPVCVRCKTSWRSRVGGLDEKPRCPKCGGKMIALIRQYERETLSQMKNQKKELPESEMKKLLKIASLVAAHGKKAVLALAGRGIGPDTAARILRGLHDTEDDFLRDILAAEVNYARTKRFWD